MKGHPSVPLSSFALLLAALGCSGRSSTAFDEPPAAGARGGSAGDGAAGGSGGGTSGAGGVSTGGSGAGGGNAGATGGGGSGAGGMASAGDGGAPSAGTAGTPSGGMSGSAGVAGAPSDALSGTWSMFVFEDPVVVEIQQRGSVLSGTGCCTPSADLCCGALTGSITGDEATFSFPTGPGAQVYSATVRISENAERLGGDFTAGNQGSKMAWVRATPGSVWLPPNAELAQSLGADRSGLYALMLSSERVGRFEPLEEYELYLDVRPDRVLLRGALGPFHTGEMTYDANAEKLLIGPVPATDPAFAVELTLEFSGPDLKRVVATYADEPDPYFFAATRR